ncbi:hypothetical protein SAMN04488505_105246 [Chitinophaga rupis]|uniref:Uncharacterized protein n=1 Tax=Chitinophaga rupis TaxID=573321 RepID=A0A1H8A1G7_9BACT|nr:hypothetical protein SAMN04488505_105246 [Chitinophaga rupis]
MAFERSQEDPPTKINSNKDLNTTTPYEKLIAAKLDEVPVPDMSDSIWASIEMQLDAVVDTPKEKPAQKFTGKGWYGFAGITVAAIALFWYYSYKDPAPEHTAPPKNIPAAEAPLPAPDTSTMIKDIEKKAVPVKPLKIKKDSPLVKDSISAEPAPVQDVPPLKVDSQAFRYDRIQGYRPDSISIKPVDKKPKGVKGITPDDYKISGKN